MWVLVESRSNNEVIDPFVVFATGQNLAPSPAITSLHRAYYSDLETNRTAQGHRH